VKREKEFLDIVWILGNDIYVRNLILDGFYYHFQIICVRSSASDYVLYVKPYTYPYGDNSKGESPIEKTLAQSELGYRRGYCSLNWHVSNPGVVLF